MSVDDLSASRESTGDKQRRRKAHRGAALLALVALGVYLAFILAGVLRA